MTFAKLFLIHNNTNWIDNLENVIKNYNNSPHSSLNNLSPIEAGFKSNFEKVLDINILKNNAKKIINDKLKIGDIIRKRVAGMFSKSSDPQFSHDTYTVTKIKGQTVTLSDGSTKKRHDILIVPVNTNNPANNILKETNKDNRIDRRVNKEGVERNNDIAPLVETVKTGRIRKQTQHYDPSTGNNATVIQKQKKVNPRQNEINQVANTIVDWNNN